MYEEFTSIQWGQRQRPEDNIILNVMKDHFTENSYVKVYDPNHNLLKSVTLSDFPKPLFNVNSGINYTHFRIVTALGVYDASDLTLELSEDLQQYQRYDVAYFMYSNNTTQLRTEGPWISNQEVIEQITNLEASNTEELVFSGFERDAHDSHLYHAKWAPPSHEK